MDSKTEPASEAKERIEKVVNEFISEIEDKYFLDELGPGGNWKVKDGMEREHIVIDSVKDLIYDLEEESTRLKAELERERELRKEIVRLVHKFQYDTKVSLISEIQSLIEKAKN